MAQRVVLHIGPRKTATTYLQRVLQALVRAQAIPAEIYPVRTRGRLDHNQVPGLIDLARSRGEIGLQDDAWTQQDGSDADRLLNAVAEAPGDVILSAEALSVLRASGAQAIVDALTPAPVDVIVTARALDRVLPSSWQQHVRNANIEGYTDYLDLRAEERESRIYDTELKRAFWRAYRYGDLVRRWQEVARSVSLVTVPSQSADASETWRRFRLASGVAELPEDPPPIPDDVANVSLTAAETFVLHGYNLAARAAGQGRRDVRAFHRQLVKKGWADREDRGPRLGLPMEMRELVHGWSTDDVADLESCTVAVYGDVNDLRCDPDRADPGLPSADDIARAAGAALALVRDDSLIDD
jgi:hypothetical protein